MENRLVGALVAACAAGTVQAVEIGADWKIVRPDVGESVVTFALHITAEEIQRDIGEATGHVLPIVTLSQAKDGPAIWLGETAARRAGLMKDDMRAFQNVIAEKSGSIYLFGRDMPGFKGAQYHDTMRSCIPSARAAARFLRDRAGVRFLMPGTIGTEVTHRGPVTLADGTFDRENPMMDYSIAAFRGFFCCIGNGIFGCGLEHTYGGHSYEPAVPGQKYAKDHPEYYGLINGKRMAVNGQAPLCVSNPAVQQLMVDELCRRFDEGADSCQLGQQDGFRGCECENCAAIGGGGLDWGERLWLVHRDIAARVAKLRPGKIVHIMCYGPTANPPKTFKVFPENVMIELCSYSEEAFDTWSQYTVPQGFTVYTYIWGNFPRPGYTPKNSFPHTAMLARRFARHRLRGLYRCGYGELFGMEGPFYYLFNVLLENPDADVKAVVNEYCQAAFGPAAPQMLAFYERLSRQLQVNSLITEGWSGRDIGKSPSDYRQVWAGNALPLLGYIYSPDAIAAMEASLSRAEKTFGLSEKMKRRLEVVRIEWDYAKNLGMIANFYAAYKLQPTKETFAPLAAAVRARNAMLDYLYVKSPTPGKIPGWPDYTLFGGYGRKSVETNGRLSAMLAAPLNWNIDLLEKTGVLPGASKKSMKAAHATRSVAAGDFESGDWARASWQPLVGSQLQALTHGARVKALYDDEALYVAIDSDLDDARAVKDYGADGMVWEDESVEVLVDPTGSQARYYHFIVGPQPGAVYDEAAGLIADPLHPLFGKLDPSWNARGVTVTNRRANGRWTALVRIPYADLDATRPAAGAVWGLNLCRLWDITKGDNGFEIAFWNPNLESASFAAPEAMGTLTFE